VERVVRHFQEELEALQGRLLEMGGLAEERVRAAVHGLVSRDIAAIDRVLYGDEPINELHVEVDNRCFKLLALHQPMATDLRAIVAAVKINTDLERVGDLAVNIAEAARRYATHPPVKKLIDIPQMGDIAQAMLRDALDSYVRRDTVLAHQVLNEDDRLDGLKTHIFRELLSYMLDDPATVEPALDLILISRHLERIGDHRDQRRRGRDLHGVGARRSPSRAESARLTVWRGPRSLHYHWPDGRCPVVRSVPHTSGRPAVAAFLQRAMPQRRPGAMGRWAVSRAGRAGTVAGRPGSGSSWRPIAASQPTGTRRRPHPRLLWPTRSPSPTTAPASSTTWRSRTARFARPI